MLTYPCFPGVWLLGILSVLLLGFLQQSGEQKDNYALGQQEPATFSQPPSGLDFQLGPSGTPPKPSLQPNLPLTPLAPCWPPLSIHTHDSLLPPSCPAPSLVQSPQVFPQNKIVCKVFVVSSDGGEADPSWGSSTALPWQLRPSPRHIKLKRDWMSL